MDQSTKPSPGVLAVIVSGANEKSDVASVLKLDAISEAASFKFVKGQVKLSVLVVTRGIKEKRVTVLPIRLADAEMPSFLTDVLYAEGDDPATIASALAGSPRHPSA